LRPWRAGDEAALVRHADDHAVWRNLMDSFPHPYRAKDAAAWIRRNLASRGPATQFAVLEAAGRAGEPVGGIGFERLPDIHRLTARLGYWLGRSHWGKGLATEAVRLVTTYAFERFDFERLEAEVLDWNPASRRVLEKAGYERECRQRRRIVKDGELLDGWLYVQLRPAGKESGR
jgi:RimJ/RimL family protein N-acetyltransferase